jgi:hypothetical protein
VLLRTLGIKICELTEEIGVWLYLSFREPLDTAIVERETRLAADKETGRLTLAVEYDSSRSEVVYR